MHQTLSLINLKTYVWYIGFKILSIFKSTVAVACEWGNYGNRVA